MSTEEQSIDNSAVLQNLLQAAALVARDGAPVQAAKTPQEIIAQLEAQVEAMHGEFSWHLHNDLRHHYLAVDARESRRHVDIILRHAIMDAYTLDTLADWHFTHGDMKRGISRLEHLIELYDQYPHLQAACLMRLGDAYLDTRRIALATEAFKRVLEIEVETVAPYREMAEARLKG